MGGPVKREAPPFRAGEEVTPDVKPAAAPMNLTPEPYVVVEAIAVGANATWLRRRGFRNRGAAVHRRMLHVRDLAALEAEAAERGITLRVEQPEQEHRP